VEATLRRAEDVGAAAELLRRVSGAEPEVDTVLHHVSVAVADGVETLGQALVALRDAGLEVDDIGIRRPTLDEVFLELTGRRTDEEVRT
jgi:ABC-2 type transport system ATP-binding protein